MMQNKELKYIIFMLEIIYLPDNLSGKLSFDNDRHPKGNQMWQTDKF